MTCAKERTGRNKTEDANCTYYEGAEYHIMCMCLCVYGVNILLLLRSRAMLINTVEYNFIVPAGKSLWRQYEHGETLNVT